MRRSTVLGLFAGLALLVALTAMPAGAKRGGANGRIVFARFDPALGDTVAYAVNPDGSHEQQVRPEPNECPRWSPDGARIATCSNPSGGATRIINPDDGSYRDLPAPDPALFSGCGIWSPDGAQFACESFGLDDPGLNGLYTIRSSDGGGLTRMTSNPGGDDWPGDYSPEGRRFVFARIDANGNSLGLFVVNVNGTGLKQIMPAGTLLTSQGDWSPQGNEIVFSQRVTADVRSSIWVVHADGTGLHQIPVRAQPACGGALSDPGSQGCFEPRWSPDGTKIVFARGTSGDNDSNIYTVNCHGTGLTQVTHGGRDQAPDWGTHPLVG
jgi:Tol biopolymer transport system component